MGVTVAEVLALPVVRAGEPEVHVAAGLDRQVRWVHVGDAAAVADLLTGGELILTTGPALASDPGGYCTALADAGAVGLVVELGPRLPDLPAAAVAAAERAGMALVALRREIRFIALTEHVHRAIVAAQFDEVEFARHAHQVFTELSMRRADADAIVTAAADLLGTPVALEDTGRRVLSLAAHGRATADLLEGWPTRSRADGVAVSVGADGKVFARLVAPLAEPTPRVAMVLERTAQALALREMVERDRTALEQQAQHGLLDDLRTGRISDEAGASARARNLGLEMARYYVPICVLIDMDTGHDELSTRRRQVQVHDALRHALGLARLTAISSVTGSAVDVVVACPAPDPDAAVDRAGLLMIAEVGRVRGVRAVTIGAGPAVGRIVDAVAGIADAHHVAAVVAAMPRAEARVHRSADTRLRGLLALLADDPRVRAFAAVELRRITDGPEPEANLELLRAFLETAGNKTELARRLHVSRPTLYARLATLQERLAVDLDDGTSRTSLHAALLVRDAIGPLPPR
ncbi:PucR family transcriptional regulator [Tsukamurella sp. NPDC003166]|uniref:PucR family transcriptional regulator n=1 Tax=Tsukamurella sp. NPDC003166 TaxID=3154444 RepID=UPI0033BA6970